MDHLHLFHLFYHGFGIECIRVNPTNMVIIYWFQDKEELDEEAATYIASKEGALNRFTIRRLPFDWQNPYGFFIVITMEYSILSYGLTFGGCVLVFAIGAFCYGVAWSKIIKCSLFSIHRSTQANVDQSILFEQIIEFLELHSRNKQLRLKLIETFQEFLFPFLSLIVF